jgi:L-cysteine/cystine lyase
MSTPDWNAIRAEFPVTAQMAYLNTGSAGPLARRTAEAMAAALERQLQDGRGIGQAFIEELLPRLEDLRAGFARLLGAEAGEIALTHHATEGMNIAVWGYDWQPGDEVVTTNVEHEAGLLPALVAARRRGVVVRQADLSPGAGDPAARIAEALTERTRMVVLSHVSFKTGAVLPLAEIAALAHRAGAWLVADGAQSAGAMPVDVRALDVDAYAVAGHKWLCGPEGMGALYVRRELLEALRPTFVGFFALRDLVPLDLSGGVFSPAENAQRYETSTVYMPGAAGMLAALGHLEQIGPAAVFERIRRLAQHCRELLSDVPGVRLVTPEPYAGLTTCELAGADAKAVEQALLAQGVLVRTLPNTNCLRVSTGFYNDEADLARLSQGLRQALRA